MRIQSLLGELKRRKVFQVTGVYLVAAWGLSAGAADIFEVLGFPLWASRYFVIMLFSLTPVVIAIAWIFELDRSGIQRDTGIGSQADQTTILARVGNMPVITATWLGQKHTFASSFVVGRDEACALQIVDPLISRQHAKFEFQAGRWKVADLGSANGIVVNGEKVQTAWLDQDSSIAFYPDGPVLELSLASPQGAKTQLAPSKSS